MEVSVYLDPDRRGLDARSIPPVKFRIPDLMLIASRVMELVHAHSPESMMRAARP